MNERTLPHNLDAERSVLGAILLRNDAINAAVEVLQPEDFYREAHQLLFEHMIQLSERSAAIDLVTLAESLSRADALEKVGGPAYITRLVDGVPRTTNIEHYAQIVKEKATLRRLITEAGKIARTPTTPSATPARSSTRPSAASSASPMHASATGFVPLSDLVNSALDTVEKLQQYKSAVTGVATGFYDLDHMTSGMQPTDLVDHRGAAVDGQDELRAQHRADRSAAVRQDRGHLQPRDVEGAAVHAHAHVRGPRGLAALCGRACCSSATPGHRAGRREAVDGEGVHRRHGVVGVLEMRAKARRLKAEHDLRMLVIDYVQLMQGRGRFENRQQELASAFRAH